MDVIVGTAGHIDHGKTALVKALTGVDADRLPEEKQRGITIDLGFARLDAGSVNIGIVDVPGHERFVKNMLAGASGIDIVMMIVAADEGVMPQTREHFDICRLLRIPSGLIALTKSDLVDEDTLELARLDVAELVKGSFLEAAPVIAVSSRTGTGVADLKSALLSEAAKIRRRRDVFEARLPIDRSFSVKGFGAVVTGTLAAGSISEGDELELLPEGRIVRVRGLQTHGVSAKTALPGQRVAVNLAGIGHEELTRGMTLAAPGSQTVTQVFDAEVEVLDDAPRELVSRQRVRLHIGTAEVLARISVIDGERMISPGQTGFVQFRLESPIATAAGERFVIRTYSPQRTIAGGQVLDPAAPRHRRSGFGKVREHLGQLVTALTEGNPVEVFVVSARENAVTFEALRSRTGLRRDDVRRLIEEAKEAGRIVEAEGVFVARDVFDKLMADAIKSVETHHQQDKLSRGISRETLREKVFRRSGNEWFRAVIQAAESAGKIVFDQDVFKLASHETKLSPAEAAAQESLKKSFFGVGFEIPKLDDALRSAADASRLDPKATRRVFQLLVNSGELVAVSNEFYFPSEILTGLASRLRDHVRATGDPMIDVAKFKDIAGVSRKYAIPLLEYFDRTRVTVRVGDKRKVLG